MSHFDECRSCGSETVCDCPRLNPEGTKWCHGCEPPTKHDGVEGYLAHHASAHGGEQSPKEFIQKIVEAVTPLDGPDPSDKGGDH